MEGGRERGREGESEGERDGGKGRQKTNEGGEEGKKGNELRLIWLIIKVSLITEAILVELEKH